MAFYHWRNFPEKNPVLLWDETPGWMDGVDQDPPSLTPYLAENAKSAIVVCPGGGYAMKASHEAEDIAQMYQAHGISAFVLNYRVAPFRHPWPLRDVRRAISFVRAKGCEYGLPEGAPIAVIGFSAGGHLATTAATLYDLPDFEPMDEIDRTSNRPDAAILCYPVVSLISDKRHHGSRVNLLGEDAPEELVKHLSGELAVREDAPPMFLWHTADDGAVPVENSLMMSQALRDKKIPFEMHIFPHGEHGLGLAPESPVVAQWAELSVTFLKNLGF